MYTSERDVVDVKLDELETDLPEYVSRTHVLSSPSYLKATPYTLCDLPSSVSREDMVIEGVEWLK